MNVPKTALIDIITRYFAMLKELFLFLIALEISTGSTFAVSDPRQHPNNKVGINSLSPDAEIAEASSLVNNGGDWGWVVIVVKKDERNLDRWQSVLDQATKRHLIPIIRLATTFDQKGYWQKPTDEDAKDWAGFLSRLYFPTKNRYVQVYNEVNRAAEWGGTVDAAGYAKELNKTVDALKAKSSEFFVLNAPLDLALNDSASSLNAQTFYQTMAATVPKIFTRIDGWASHSYPNPDFSSSPYKSGRTSIDGYIWELSQIASNTDNKDLPVFITETGWKRNTSSVPGLSEDQISKYYETAFNNIWNDKKVVAVAPFVFDYPEQLFNQFSFKADEKIVGKKYYDYFFAIKDLAKTKGEPERENSAADFTINLPGYIIKGERNSINIEIKNTGNYIWNPKANLHLVSTSSKVSIKQISWEKDEVYPGQNIKGKIEVSSKDLGTWQTKTEVKDGNKVLAIKDVSIDSETYLSLFFKAFKSFFD